MKLMSEQQWNAVQYQKHAGFVPELGTPVLELLSPQPGERILDLGCGDGVLTEKIVQAGAQVVGVDAAPGMVEAARRRGIDARCINGAALAFNTEFDAVFSNAALHWMRDADAVIDGVRRALKLGGRFAGEMGGFGNVASIVVALMAVLTRRGVAADDVLPWYYPTAGEYRAKLEKHGFTVTSIALIPRPTPLPTGIGGWLDTFTQSLFARLPEIERQAARNETIDLLRHALCDAQGRWIADYVRLRFACSL